MNKIHFENTNAELINNYLKELFPNRQIVAFYIGTNYVVPDTWMAVLGQKLQERGFAVIGVLTPETENLMNLDALGNILIVNKEDIKFLNNIAAFIVADVEWRTSFPQQSRVLAVAHACAIKYDPAVTSQISYFSHCFDGFLAGYKFKHKAAELNNECNNLPVPAHLSLRNIDKPFYFMGYGYPKLFLASKQYKKLLTSTEKNCICYAPTTIDYRLQEGEYRVKNYGVRIIRALLHSFPNYNIIFRPMPMDRAHPDVVRIIDYFSNEKRFYFDTKNNYIDTFARSKTIISDFSHIVTNFNIIAQLPAIYFKP